MEGLVLISYHIRPGSQQELLAWQEQIARASENFPGFVQSFNLQPKTETEAYYTLLRFANETDAQNWVNSSERKAMLDQAEVTFMEKKGERVYSWADFWQPGPLRLKKWKQLMMTFLAVYPIAQLFPYLYKVLLPQMGIDLGNFVNGILIGLSISAAMNYVLMPFIMKNFSKWMAR